MNGKKVLKPKSRLHHWLFWQGSMLILVAVMSVWGAGVYFRYKGIAGVSFNVAMVFMSMVAGVILVAGVANILRYFRISRSKDYLLKRFSEDEIAKHLSMCNQHTFKTLGIFKTYFTNCMIIIPRKIMIDYQTISMMYQHEIKFKDITVCYVVRIRLLDGQDYSICGTMNKDELLEVVRICYQYNPNILFENTKSNRAVHKERVARYKKGLINIRKIDLDWANREGVGRNNRVVLPREIVEQIISEPDTEDKRKQYGEHLKISGILIVIVSIVLAILVGVLSGISMANYSDGSVADVERQKQISALVGSLAMSPMTIIGIVMYFIGKRKMER
nr:hypothetical protein [Eubacterium sp.]